MPIYREKLEPGNLILKNKDRKMIPSEGDWKWYKRGLSL